MERRPAGVLVHYGMRGVASALYGRSGQARFAAARAVVDSAGVM